MGILCNCHRQQEVCGDFGLKKKDQSLELMGRGGKNNQHSGTEKLRGMARLESENYRKSSKKGKSQISRQLVNQVRSLLPAGR